MFNLNGQELKNILKYSFQAEFRRREYEKQTEISFRLPILDYIDDHL